jgi:hypothetical protein
MTKFSKMYHMSELVPGEVYEHRAVHTCFAMFGNNNDWSYLDGGLGVGVHFTVLTEPEEISIIMYNSYPSETNRYVTLKILGANNELGWIRRRTTAPNTFKYFRKLS